MALNDLTPSQRHAVALIYYNNRHQYYDQLPQAQTLQAIGDIMQGVSLRSPSATAIINAAGISISRIPIEEGKQYEWIGKANQELLNAGIDLDVFRFTEQSNQNDPSRLELFPEIAYPGDTSYHEQVEQSIISEASAAELTLYNQIDASTFDIFTEEGFEKFFNENANSIIDSFFGEDTGQIIIVDGGNTSSVLLSALFDVNIVQRW